MDKDPGAGGRAPQVERPAVEDAEIEGAVAGPHPRGRKPAAGGAGRPPGQGRTVQTHAGPAVLIREWWPTSDLDPNRWFLVQYPDGTRRIVRGEEIVAAGAQLKEQP